MSSSLSLRTENFFVTSPTSAGPIDVTERRTTNAAQAPTTMVMSATTDNPMAMFYTSGLPSRSSFQERKRWWVAPLGPAPVPVPSGKSRKVCCTPRSSARIAR